jgi:hypothetical protein|eukprot:COSAG06_NODE_2468_length_6806_cov_3.728940_6_plen_125_part_00
MDQATKQSNWVRLFSVANDFDSWGQIAEAEEAYTKLITQIQTDRAAWPTGTVGRPDNVRSRVLLSPRRAGRESRQLTRRRRADPAVRARPQESIDSAIACLAARVEVRSLPAVPCAAKARRSSR